MTDESSAVDEAGVPDTRQQNRESRISVSAPTGNAAHVDQLERAFDDSVFPAQALEEVQQSVTQNYMGSDYRGASTRQDLPSGETGGRQLHFSTSQPQQREVSGSVNAAVDRTAFPSTAESETNVVTTPQRATMRIRYQPPSAVNAPLADIQIAKLRSRMGSQAPSAAATPRGSHPSIVSQAVARGIADGVSQAQAAMERRMASRRQSRQASRMSRRLSPRGSFAARESSEVMKQNLLQAREALRRFEDGVDSERFSGQLYSASTDHPALCRGIRCQSLSEPRVTQVPVEQPEQIHVAVAPPAAGGEGSAGENAEQRELNISSPTSRGARRPGDKPSGPFYEEAVPDEHRREVPADSSRRASQTERPARLDVVHAERVQSGIMHLAQLDQQRRASRIASRMGSRPISRSPALLGSSVLRNRGNVAKAAAEELSRRLVAENLKAAVAAEATNWGASGQQDRAPTRREQQETRSHVNRQLTPSDKKRELVEADTAQMPRGADIESRASFLIREFCSAPIHAHLPLSDRGGNCSPLDRPSVPTSEEEKPAPRARVKSGSSQGESFLGRLFSTLLTFSSAEAASPRARRRRSFVPIISPSTQSPRQTSLSSSSQDSFRPAEPQATSSPSEGATASVRGVPRRAHSRRPVRLGRFHEQLPRKALTVTYENCERLLRLWPQSDGASSASSVGTSSSGSHSGRPAGMTPGLLRSSRFMSTLVSTKTLMTSDSASCACASSGLCTPVTCGRARTWRGSSSRIRRHRTDNSLPERFTHKRQAHCIASVGEWPPGATREVRVVDASASSSRTSSFYSSSGSLSPRILPVKERCPTVSVPVLDFSWLEKVASKRERSGLPPQPRMCRPAVQKKRVSPSESGKLNARLRKQQLSIAREVSLLATRRSVKFVKRMLSRRATIGPVGQREPEKILGVEAVTSRSPASDKVFTFDRSAPTFMAKGMWRAHGSLEGIKGASAAHGRSISTTAGAAVRRPLDNMSSKKRPESLSLSSSFEPEDRFTPEVDDHADASVTPKSPLAWLSHQEHTWNMSGRITDSDSGVYKAAIYSEARETSPVSQASLSQRSISEKPVDQPSISSAQAAGFSESALQGGNGPRLGRADSVGNSRFTDADVSVSLSKFTSTKGKFVYASSKKGPNRVVAEEGCAGLYIAVEPVLERCRSPDTSQVCHGVNFGAAANKEEIAQIPADAGDFSAREGSARLPLVVREVQNTVVQSIPPPAPVGDTHTVEKLECDFLGQAQAGVRLRRRRRARSGATAHRGEVTRSCLPTPVESMKRSKSVGSLRRIDLFDSVLPELTRGNRTKDEFVLADRKDSVKTQNREVSMVGQTDVMKKGLVFRWLKSRAIQESEPFNGENISRKSFPPELMQPDLTGSLWGNTQTCMERRPFAAADETPVQRTTCNSEIVKRGIRDRVKGYEGPRKNVRTHACENTSRDERTELSSIDRTPAVLQTLQGEYGLNIRERPHLRGAGGNFLFLPGFTEGSATLSNLCQSQAGSTRPSPKPFEEAREYSDMHVDASANAPFGGAQSQDFKEAEDSNERKPCLHPASARRVHSSEIRKTGPVSAAVTREMEVFKKSRGKGDFTRDVRGRKVLTPQRESDISDREANAENRSQHVSSSMVRSNVCEGRTTSGVEAAAAPLSEAEEETVTFSGNEVRATQATSADDKGVRSLQRFVDAVAVEGNTQPKALAQVKRRQTECLPFCGARHRVENGSGAWKADKMTSASEGEQRDVSPPQVGKPSCEGVCSMQKDGESASQLRGFVRPKHREYIPKGLMQPKRIAVGVRASQCKTAEQANGAKTLQLVNFAEALTQEAEGDRSFLDLTVQAGHSARNLPGEHGKVTDKRLPVKEATNMIDFSGGVSQGQHGKPLGEAARGGNHTSEAVFEDVFTEGLSPGGEHLTKAATISLGHDFLTRGPGFQEKMAFTWEKDYRGQAGHKAGILTISTSSSGIFSTEVPGDGLGEMRKSPVSGEKREVPNVLPKKDVQARAQAPGDQTCETPTYKQKAITSARGREFAARALPDTSTADIEHNEGSAKVVRKKVRSELLSVNLGNGVSAVEAAEKGVLLEAAEEVRAESVVVHVAEGPTRLFNAKQPHVLQNMEKPVRKGNEDIHIGKPGVRVGPITLPPSSSCGESLRDVERATGSIDVLDNGSVREANEREDVQCAVEVKVRKRPQQTDDQQGRGESDRTKHKLSRTAESSVPLTKFATEISTEAVTGHFQRRYSADGPSQRKARDTGRQKGAPATRTVDYLSGTPFRKIVSEEEDTIQLYKEEDALAARGEGRHVFVREQKATKLPFNGRAKDAGLNESNSEQILHIEWAFVPGGPLRKSKREKRLQEGSSKEEAFEVTQGNDAKPSICKEEAANVGAGKQYGAALPEVEASWALPEKKTVMVLRGMDAHGSPGDEELTSFSTQDVTEAVREQKVNFLRRENAAKAAPHKGTPTSVVGAAATWTTPKKKSVRRLPEKAGAAAAPLEAKSEALLASKASGPPVEGNTTSSRRGKQMSRSSSQEDTDVCTRGGGAMEAGHDGKIRECVFAERESKCGTCSSESELLEAADLPHRTVVKPLNRLGCSDSVSVDRWVSAREIRVEKNSSGLVPFEGTSQVFPEKKATPHVSGEGGWLSLPENDAAKSASDKPALTVVREHEICKNLLGKDDSEPVREDITHFSIEEGSTVSVRGNEAAKTVRQKGVSGNSSPWEQLAGFLRMPTAGREQHWGPPNAKVDMQRKSRGQSSQRQLQSKVETRVAPAIQRADGGRRLSCASSSTVPVGNTGNNPGGSDLKETRCADARDVPARGLPRAKSAEEFPREASEACSAGKVSGDGGRRTQSVIGFGGDETGSDEVVAVQGGSSEWRRQMFSCRLQLEKSEFIARWRSTVPVVQREELGDVKVFGRSVKMQKGRGRREAASNGDICEPRIGNILPAKTGDPPSTFSGVKKSLIEKVKSMWTETETDVAGMNMDLTFMGTCGDGGSEAFCTAQSEDSLKSTERAREQTAALEKLPGNSDAATSLPGQTMQPEKGARLNLCNAVSAASPNARVQDGETSGPSAAEVYACSRKYSTSSYPALANHEAPITTASVQKSSYSGQAGAKLMHAALQDTLKQETGSTEERQRRECASVERLHTRKPLRKTCVVGRRLTSHSDSSCSSAVAVPSASAASCETTHDRERSGKIDTKDFYATAGNGGDVAVTCRDTVQAGKPGDPTVAKRHEVEQNPRVSRSLAETPSLTTGEQSAALTSATAGRGTLCRIAAVTNPPKLIESSPSGLHISAVALDVQVAVQGDLPQRRTDVGGPVSPTAVADDVSPSTLPLSNGEPREVWATEEFPGEEVSGRRKNEDTTGSAALVTGLAEDKKGEVTPCERNEVATLLVCTHTPKSAMEAQRRPANDSASHAARELASTRDPNTMSKPQSEPGTVGKSVVLPLLNRATAATSSKAPVNEGKEEGQEPGIHGIGERPRFRRTRTKKSAAGTAGETHAGVESFLSSDKLVCQMWRVTREGRGDADGLFRLSEREDSTTACQTTEERNLAENLYYGERRPATQSLETLSNWNKLDCVPEAVPEKATRTQPGSVPAVSKLGAALSSVEDPGGVIFDPSREHAAQFLSRFYYLGRTKSQVTRLRPQKLNTGQNDELETVICQGRAVGASGTTKASPAAAQAAGVRKNTSRMLLTSGVVRAVNSLQVDAAAQREDPGTPRNTCASKCVSGLSFVRGKTVTESEGHRRHEGLSKPRLRSFREDTGDSVEMQSAREGDGKRPAGTAKLSVGEKTGEESKAVVDEPADGVQHCIPLQSARGMTPAPVHRRVSFVSALGVQPTTGESAEGKEAVSINEQEKSEHLRPAGVDGSLSPAVLKEQQSLEEISVLLDVSASHEVPATCTGLPSETAVLERKSTAACPAAHGRYRAEQAALPTGKEQRRCGHILTLVGAPELSNPSETLTATSAFKLPVPMLQGSGDRSTEEKRESVLGEEPQTRAPMSSSASESGTGEISESRAAAGACVECGGAADARSVAAADVTTLKVPEETASTSSVPKALQRTSLEKKYIQTSENASAASNSVDVLKSGGALQGPLGVLEEKAAPHVMSCREKVSSQDMHAANVNSAPRQAGTEMPVDAIPRAALAPSALGQAESLSSPSQTCSSPPAASAGPDRVPTGFAGSKAVPLSTEWAPPSVAAEAEETEVPSATFSEAGEREGNEEVKLICSDLPVENEKCGQIGLLVAETGDDLDRWDSTMCPSPPFSPRYVPPTPAPSRRPVPPLNLYWLRRGEGRPRQKKHLKDLATDLRAGLCAINPPEISAVTLPAITSLHSDDELDRKKADIIASLFDDAADLDIEGQKHQPRVSSSGQTPPCVSTTRSLLVTTAPRDPQERPLDLEKSPELKAPRGEHPPIFRGWDAAEKLPSMGETAHRYPFTNSHAFVSVRADDKETKPPPPAGRLTGKTGVCAEREKSQAVARTRPRSAEAELRNLYAFTLPEAPNAGDRQLEDVGVGAVSDVDDAVVRTSGARSKTISAARRRYRSGGSAPLYPRVRPHVKRSYHSPTMLPSHVKKGEEAAMVESTTKHLEDSWGSRTRQPRVRVLNTATAQGYIRKENSPPEPCPPHEATSHQPCSGNFVTHLVDRRAEPSPEFLPETKALMATLRSPKQKMLSQNRLKKGTEEFSDGRRDREFTIAHESHSAGAGIEHVSGQFGGEFEVCEAATCPYQRPAAVDTGPVLSSSRQRAPQVSPHPVKEQTSCPDESSPLYGRIPKEESAAEAETAGTSASRRSANGLAAKEKVLENTADEAAKECEASRDGASLLDMALECSHLSAARKDLQSFRGRPRVCRIKSRASAENISALIKSATMLLRTNQAMGSADTATARDVGVWRNGKRWKVPVSEAGTSNLEDRRPLSRPSPATELQKPDDEDELEGDKRVGANTRKSGGRWRDRKGHAFTNDTVSMRATAPAGLYRFGDAMGPIAGGPPRCDTSNFGAKAFQNEGKAGGAAPTLRWSEGILRKDSIVAERIRSFERMAWTRQTARSSSGTSNGTTASNRRKDRKARFPPTRKEETTGSPSAVSTSEGLVHSKGFSRGKVDLSEATSAATTRKLAVVAKGPHEGDGVLTSQRSYEAAPQEAGRRSSSSFVEEASLAEGEPTVLPWQSKQGHREKADLNFKKGSRRRPQRLSHDTFKSATPFLSHSTESGVGSLAKGDFTAFSRQSVQPQGWKGLTLDEGAATPGKRIDKTLSHNQAVAGAGTVVQSKKQTSRSMVTTARRERQEGTSGTNGNTDGDSPIQEECGELQQDTAEPVLHTNQGSATTTRLRIGNTTAHRLPRREPLACSSADVSSSWEREESPQRERREQRGACVASEQHVDSTATESCAQLSLFSVAHGDFTSPQSTLQRDIRRPLKTAGDAKTRPAEEGSKSPQGGRNVIDKRSVAYQPALTHTSQTTANGSLEDLALPDREEKLLCGRTACKQDSETESHKSVLGKAERATVIPAASTGEKAEAITPWRPVTAPDVEAAECSSAVISCQPDRNRLQTPLRAHTETLFANAARLKKTAGFFPLNARAVADVGNASAGETTRVASFIQDVETNNSFFCDCSGDTPATAGDAETPCTGHNADLKAARSSRGPAVAHQRSEKDTRTSVEVSDSSAKASAAGTAEKQSSTTLSETWKPTKLWKAAAGAALSCTAGVKRRASHQLELPELRTTELPAAVPSTTGGRKAWKCLPDITALVEPSHELAAENLEEAKAVFLQSWWKAVTVRKWVNAAKCVRDFESSTTSVSSPGRLHAPEYIPPLQDGSSHVVNPKDVVLANATPEADLTAACAAPREYAAPSSRRKNAADLFFDVLETDYHEKQTKSSSTACRTLPQNGFGGRVKSEPGCGSNAEHRMQSSTSITKTTSECEAESSYRREFCQHSMTPHAKASREKRKVSSWKGLALTSACSVFARDGQMRLYPRHKFLLHPEAESVEAEQSCQFSGVRRGNSKQHEDGRFTDRASVVHPQRVSGNTVSKDAVEGCRNERGNQQYEDRLECVETHGGQVEARAAEGPEANDINRQEACANGRQTEVHGGNTKAAENQDFNTSCVMALVLPEEGPHRERYTLREIGIRSKQNQRETFSRDLNISPRHEAERGDSSGPGECRQLTEGRQACEQARQLKEVRDELPTRIKVDSRGDVSRQATRCREETGESLDGKGLTGEKLELVFKRGLEKSMQEENRKRELQNAGTKKQLRECIQATTPSVTEDEAEIPERVPGEICCKPEKSSDDVERGNSRPEKLVTVGKQKNWEVRGRDRELAHGKELFRHDGESPSSKIHHKGFFSDKEGDAELAQVGYNAKGRGTWESHILATERVKLDSCIESSDCTMRGGRAVSPYGCKDAREERVLVGQKGREGVCRSLQRACSGIAIPSTKNKGKQSGSGSTREAKFHLLEEPYPKHAPSAALTPLQGEARICASKDAYAHPKEDPTLTHGRVEKQKGTVTRAAGQVKIGGQRQNQKKEARGELEYVRIQRDYQAPSTAPADVAEREVFRNRDELENVAEVEGELLVSWRAANKDSSSHAQSDQGNGTAEAHEHCRGEALFRSSEEKAAAEKQFNMQCSSSERNVPGSDDEAFLTALEADDEEDTFAQLVGAKKASLL